jgi:hypothetical protein
MFAHAWGSSNPDFAFYGAWGVSLYKRCRGLSSAGGGRKDAPRPVLLGREALKQDEKI